MPEADYTRCRTYGHAWFEADADWRTDLGAPITLRCERCMSERRDVISRTTGELVSRHYNYPQGYAYEYGARPSLEEFRLMLLALGRRERRTARARAAS